MIWLKRILIGAGIVFALLVALIVAAGYFAPGGPGTQSMSMTVGNRSVTVSGYYKNMTQESLADGVKVVVDGHEILVSGDQLTVDGKTQVLESGQNVEVLVDEAGAVAVKVVGSDGGAANAAQ